MLLEKNTRKEIEMSITKVVNVFGCIFIGLLGAICCISLVGILFSISFDEFKYNAIDCFLIFISSFVLMGFIGLIWIMIIHPEYLSKNRKDSWNEKNICHIEASS